MRSGAAVLVTLALAPAHWSARASEPALADEVALLQRAADPSELPKLRCDMETGCRYEGLPPREKKPAFPVIPGVDPEAAKKFFENLKLPDFSQVQKDLAKVKLPDFSQLAKEAAKLMPTPAPGGAQAAPQLPDFAKIMEAAAKMLPPAAPKPQQQAPPQMPDFAKMMEAAAKMLTPAAPKAQQQGPDLAKMWKALQNIDLPPLPEAPGVAEFLRASSKVQPRTPRMSALQVSSHGNGNSSEMAHFLSAASFFCEEGPADYVKEKLKILKRSPFDAVYSQSVATEGPCDEETFDEPNTAWDMCFPKLFVRPKYNSHKMKMILEMMAFQKHAERHGQKSANIVRDMCANDWLGFMAKATKAGEDAVEHHRHQR